MRLIDADAFFESFPELAIEPYINAPTVEPNDNMFNEWFCPDCKERENSYIAGYKQAIIDGADMRGTNNG